MKLLILTIAFLSTALAAPAACLGATDERFFNHKKPSQQCPSNPAQPDGKLPKGSISTSVLVPISSKRPKKSFAATEFAKVTPNDICTIFNLDLPVAETQGKICNLVFDLPSWFQAPGLFTFFGSGQFTFTGYAIGTGAQPGVTSYENQPPPGPSPPNPPKEMKPGNSYVINAAPCRIPPELPGSVTVSGSLCSEDTTLVFKQSDKKCPLGFYVVFTDDLDAEVPH